VGHIVYKLINSVVNWKRVALLWLQSDRHIFTSNHAVQWNSRKQ